MILLPPDSWEIKVTPHKGSGLFATKAIAPGVVIGDYLGKVLRTATDNTLETDDGLYLMYYHDQASLYPTDLKKPGMHLVNHSCVPNCWMSIYQGHTLFFTLRHIFPGEELTISYLLSPKDASENACTHICRCDSPTCSGVMHLPEQRYNAWRKFSEHEAKQTKRKRITYGEELSPLFSYPESIPDNSIYPLYGATQKASLIMNDKKLPSIQIVRKLIRDSGTTLTFPALKTKILAVEDNEVISENL